MGRKHYPLIEIYPMRDTTDGGATIAEGRDIVEFYDILVRFEGDDPIEEIEGVLTYKDVLNQVRELEVRFPGSPVVEINL